MSIHRLIQQLAAPLQELRDQARAALQEAAAAAVPELILALRDAERDIRVGAALTLGALQASEAAGALARMAESDPDPSVRPLALRALSDLAHPGCPQVVVKTLLAKLSDPDLFSRALACAGLGRIGDDVCKQALQIALRDREDWVRQAARKALTALPAPPPAGPNPPAGPGAALMTASPAALAPSPADGLLERLASLDLATQRQAQEGLRGLGAIAVPRVAPLLRDPMPHVRRAAAEVLGVIGSIEAIDPLAEVLADSTTANDLRAVTLHALSGILSKNGPGTATPALVELLRHQAGSDDSFVRAAAAAALIPASPEDRGPLLEHLHGEDEEWIHVVAARALWQVAGPSDRPLIPLVLDELAQMTDPAGQRHLIETLGQILAEPQPDDGKTVVGPVSFFLDSDDLGVRSAALRLLARTATQSDPRLLRAFVGLLEADRADLEIIAAVTRLAAPGDAAPVPALSRVLARGAEEAAAAAARALATIGGRAAVDALVEVANGQLGRPTALAAQTLAAIDPAAEVIGVRRPDGRWERRLQLRCHADGDLLRFVERNGREELRCPRCDREYALSAAEKLFAADRTPHGLCLCTGCRRKQLLVRQDDSDTLVCPASGEVHIRPFDHPRQIRLLADLPLGCCSCCAEPQPLVRIDEEVRCYRTRRLYRAAARGFEPAAEAAGGEDVAAINRALLLGTLGIAESGLAASNVPPDPPPGEDPQRRR